MDGEAVRAFARRDRETVARAKAEWWAGRTRDEAWRAAAALREHVRRVRPDWPTPQDRADDLAHHVALKERLERAARALARR